MTPKAAAAYAKITRDILENQKANGASEQDREQARKLLDDIGKLEGVGERLEKMVEQTEERSHKNKKIYRGGPDCPECGSIRSSLVTSSATSFHDMNTRKRRRECAECGHRYTTYELGEDAVLELRQRLAAEFVAQIRDIAMTQGFKRRTKE